MSTCGRIISTLIHSGWKQGIGKQEEQDVHLQQETCLLHKLSSQQLPLWSHVVAAGP